MEKEKRKTTRRCSKRLLVLLFFLLFGAGCSILASQMTQKMGSSFNSLSYKIEKQHPDSVKLGMHQMLSLSFKIDAKLKKAPQIILKNPYLKMQESRVYHKENATIIEVQYKLLKAGHIKVEPILVVDGVEVKREPIEVFILPPPLSQDAQFRARFFAVKDEKFISIEGEKEEDENNKSRVMTAGEKYLLIIEGFFLHKDGDEVSVKSSSHNVSNSDGFIEDGFFVEKIDEEEIVDKNSVFDSNDGWRILQAFYFYPLKSGTLSSIEWDIHIKRKNEKFFTFILKDSSLITVLKQDSENKEKNLEDIFQKDFNQQMNEHLDKSTAEDENASKQVGFAYKIRLLREKEREDWFAYKAKEMRIKLEEELGLPPSFEPFNIRWFVLKITVSLLLIFSSLMSFLVLHFKKQRAFNFLTISLAIAGLLVLSVTMWNAEFASEHTNVGKEKLYLYSFPSEDASPLADVRIGETVRIRNEHKEWSFVEKADGKRGWMK